MLNLDEVSTEEIHQNWKFCIIIWSFANIDEIDESALS